ncbi:MAG: DUF2617 family protein [Deltaproteobacteria bacterium]|jgi:hypothetical protein|nr:DUF2617 family protein [Deltaproteobacteria bacterium]
MILTKHHYSRYLEETILTGNLPFSEKLIEPLHIVKNKQWDFSPSFKIDLFILATSHAAVLTFKNHTLIQILACSSLGSDHGFKQLNQMDLQNSNFLNYQTDTTELALQSEIRNMQLKEGKNFYGNLAKAYELSYHFSSVGNAFTGVGFTVASDQLRLNSLHSYPNEERAVVSQLEVSWKN